MGDRDHYFDGITYTEPLFVVVIHGTRVDGPLSLSPSESMKPMADVGGSTPAAWWLTILTIGPLLGSFITEPAAMTICALLLAQAVLRPWAQRQSEVRDARSVVCQRVDRWNADSLCGATGPDGCPSVGVGLQLHVRSFRLAGCPRIGISTVTYWLIFRKELVGLSPSGRCA